jgi:hypothetical protein
MKTYWGVGVYIHVFLSSALVGGEWSAPRPCRFTPEKNGSATNWTRVWAGPSARLDDMEKLQFMTLLGLELALGPLSRPTRSQSLYRLRYRGSK